MRVIPRSHTHKHTITHWRHTPSRCVCTNAASTTKYSDANQTATFIDTTWRHVQLTCELGQASWHLVRRLPRKEKARDFSHTLCNRIERDRTRHKVELHNYPNFQNARRQCRRCATEIRRHRSTHATRTRTARTPRPHANPSGWGEGSETEGASGGIAIDR